MLNENHGGFFSLFAESKSELKNGTESRFY
jgi:hypothetical protein